MRHRKSFKPQSPQKVFKNLCLITAVALILNLMFSFFGFIQYTFILSFAPLIYVVHSIILNQDQDAVYPLNWVRLLTLIVNPIKAMENKDLALKAHQKEMNIQKTSNKKITPRLSRSQDESAFNIKNI